jgi:hypothetical protein
MLDEKIGYWSQPMSRKSSLYITEYFKYGERVNKEHYLDVKYIWRAVLSERKSWLTCHSNWYGYVGK